MANVYFERGLSLSSLFRRGRHDWLTGVGVVGQPLLLSRGRDCLYVALRSIDMKEGEQVALPAFICSEVPKLVSDWGFVPVQYDINPDLSVDPERIGNVLTNRTRAVLYVNYFGFQQPQEALEPLRAMGLPLIEDNCQGPMAGSARAVQPDFAFTSLRKYLPVPDGAILDVIGDRWIERAHGLELMKRSSWHLVCWRIAALLIRYRQERRDRQVLRLVAQELFARAEQALRRLDVPVAMHWISRRLATTFDIEAIRSERRSAYEALALAMSGHGALRPVRPALGATDCPYCFPLMTDNNRLWRDALNHRGIQAAILWEGDHIPAEISVASQLARQILVIPLPRTEAIEQMVAEFS